LQKGKTAIGDVFRQDRVRIEEEDIVSPRLLQGQVVSPGESDVVGIDDEGHSREKRAEEGHAVIVRMIVDDDNLRVDATEGFLDGMQAELQKVLYPVIHYDNGEDHGGFCEVRSFGLNLDRCLKIDIFAFVNLNEYGSFYQTDRKSFKGIR